MGYQTKALKRPWQHDAKVTVARAALAGASFIGPHTNFRVGRYKRRGGWQICNEHGALLTMFSSKYQAAKNYLWYRGLPWQ